MMTNDEASFARRRIMEYVAWGMCGAAMLAAVIPLFLILAYVAKQGLAGLDWSFFTELPKPVGEEGGGMANAIVGSLEVVGIGALVGIPTGLMAGVFVAEYGGHSLARVVRFGADVLSGVPSIVVGLFVYALIVKRMGHFSAWAGGVALSILMLPIVCRTTEELLRLVPDALREGALALGVPRWRTTIFVVLRTALPGISTGIMLAVARVGGETAPLLFTAFNNRFWSMHVNEPIASLPVQIFTYSVAPYDDWHRQAWAAALVLVGFVLVLNLVARAIVRVRTT